MTARSRFVALRTLQYLLDDAFRVPGTTLRFGWDPIIGLVPWIGDALTTLLSCAILVVAYQTRVPRIVQWRMLANIALDAAISAVPVAGNVGDTFFKSNAMNFALLERHVGEAPVSTVGDWLFISAIAAAIVALALLPLLLLYWVYRLIIPKIGL